MGSESGESDLNKVIQHFYFFCALHDPAEIDGGSLCDEANCAFRSALSASKR